jgi:hypothetical protein
MGSTRLVGRSGVKVGVQGRGSGAPAPGPGGHGEASWGIKTPLDPLPAEPCCELLVDAAFGVVASTSPEHIDLLHPCFLKMLLMSPSAPVSRDPRTLYSAWQKCLILPRLLPGRHSMSWRTA